MKNIEHERAAAAFEAVSQRFRAWKTQDNKDARAYRSVALSASGTLRQVGLLQLAAFWGSKDRDAEKFVLEDLLAWLRSSGVTQTICAAADKRAAIGSNVLSMSPLGALLERKSAEIAVLEEEARRFLTWHKRFVEGHWIRLKKKKREEKEQETEEQTNGAEDEQR